MTYQLRRQLDRVERRFRLLRFWRGLAICWLFWTLAAAGLYVVAAIGHPAGPASLAVLAVVSALVLGVVAWRSHRSDLWIARRIEQRHPNLGALLLAAVEQSAPGTAPKGYFQLTVIDNAFEHSRHHDWGDTVPAGQLRWAKLTQFAALCLLLAVLAAWMFHADMVGAGILSPGSPQSIRTGDFQFSVSPGDTALERGTTLLVIADFVGAAPPDATLVIQQVAAGSESDSDPLAEDSGGTDAHSPGLGRAMSRNLSDPQFIGRVSGVDRDLDYHVRFGSQRSPTFRVTVFDYPALVRADAQLDYPRYTHLEPMLVEDIRHVTAVEGTQLTLLCRLNKQVADARLIDEAGQEIPLRPDSGSSVVYRVSFQLQASQRYRLRLTDAEQRRNKIPAEIIVNVVPNRPPEIQLTRPARDLRVSPLEEISLTANMADDFGLLDYGVAFSLGGEDAREVSLGAPDSSTTKEQLAQYLLDVESLGAVPDELISYYLWAEDAAPDGQPRRVFSDMYFAEVRHFEEIFRQGQSPPGGADPARNTPPGGGSAEAAMQLAELQKQIVAATWTLIRRETRPEPTSEFAGDARLLEESQQSALGQAEQMAERLQDPQSRDHLQQAQTHMTDALGEITTAADGPITTPLPAALVAARAAYESLLKLRAREFEVVRQNANQQSQSSGSASGAGSRARQQLQELDLSADENRYETQSRATAPDAEANQQQREMREFLDRLRQLARRQEDLNDRLRELQSALQSATTDEEREEIQRQLKRLREQQQDILRDTDELAGRMEQSENRQQLESSREQMEESRGRVQQATEALQEGRLSQALSEGTRAERELNEMRDEFRRRTSRQFDEQMRDLRETARAMDQRQQELSAELDRLNTQSQPSLRDSGQRAEVQEGLAQQREELEELSEAMRQTIQEAEQPEPLLARQLYDTLRDAEASRIDDALDITERLLEAGVPREADTVVEEADRGISQLRRGIDRAAESILGDEAQALRRAGEQLEQLADELNREIGDRLPPDQPDGQNQPSGPQDGDPPTDPSTPGQPTPGQPGQDQSAPEQPGQGQSAPGPSGRNAEPQPGDGGEGNRQVGFEEFLERGGGGPGGPITGDDFRDWADRLRDVEQMLDDRQLSTEAARIRNRAEDARAEFRRDYQEPDWQEMKQLIAEPLNELIDRIAEEVARRQSPDALVPIDRDPVPAEFADDVRRYYERLGSGR